MSDRIYTLHIDGRPIASFPATGMQEAQTLLKEEWLKDDLIALKSKGTPVWDGKQKLTVRNADTVELSKYEREVKNHAATDDLPMVYHIDLY